MGTIEVLRKARELIAKDWSQGHFSPGYCIIRALCSASGRIGDAKEALRPFVGGGDLVVWNDAPAAPRPKSSKPSTAPSLHRRPSMSDPIFADDVTAQQLFERVWTRFVIEKAPQSRRPRPEGGTHCAYRGSNGSACAVGVLVTDDECHGWDDRESAAVADLADDKALPARLVPHLDLLVDLQSAHDTDEFAGYGHFRVERLRAIARSHDLAVPEAPHA